MKYYAVTDDPNELLHYGVKGMKWGQHLFGDDLRPKSAGYKRALGKLRGFAKKAKSAVQKSATQHAMNRQKKQEDRFNKAVQKSQQRINMIENMRNVDRITSYENRVDRAYKNEQKAAKAAAKQDRKYARNERKMEKYTQLARENRLRYGKLSEDQINRIHDRLALENNTRVLGGREKPRFRTRMKDALQEGILQGVVQGTAAGMKEVAVAKIQNRLGNKRALDRQSSNEAKRQKAATQIKNKKTTREIKRDFKQEVREQEIREGIGVMDRSRTFKGAAKNLRNIEDANRERKRLQSIDDEYKSDHDRRIRDYLEDHNMDYDTAERSYLSALSQPKYRTMTNPATGETYLIQDKDATKKAKREVNKFNRLSKDEQRKLVEGDIMQRDKLEQKAQENLEDLRARNAYNANQAVKQDEERYKLQLEKYKTDLKAHEDRERDRLKKLSSLDKEERSLEMKRQSKEISTTDYLTKYEDILDRRQELQSQQRAAPTPPAPVRLLSYTDSKYLPKNNNQQNNSGNSGKKKNRGK